MILIIHKTLSASIFFIVPKTTINNKRLYKDSNDNSVTIQYNKYLKKELIDFKNINIEKNSNKEENNDTN